MKLKSTLTIFTLVTTMFLIMNNASGPGTVQDKDRTGGPLSEGACTACHTDGAFSPSVSIELLKDNVAVDKYQPGDTYDVKVTIDASEGTPSAYGFQAVALSGANNDNSGTWGTLPSGVQSLTLSNNRTYVEQSTPNTGSNSFQVEWIAPQAGTGDVSFYAAGNAVDLNGMTTGDGAAPTELTVTEEDPSSVKTEQQLFDFTIFPNPVQEVLNIKINSRQSGEFDLRITDVQGKVIKVERIELTQGQNEKSINVSNLPDGLYLIRLINDQEFVTQSMVKM